MKQLFQYAKNSLNYYTLIFILVISSNIGVGDFLLADFLYLLFGVFAIFKTIGCKRDGSVFRYVVYFAISAILLYLIYGNIRGLASSLRFVMGISICSIFYFSYNNRKYREKLINGYCYACVFFSLFVIIQFLSYYCLKFNIDFSYGEYGVEENAAGYYDPLSSLFYRTGGMFKEPSWYGAFVSPVCFLFARMKRYKELLICVCGLLMSTSGLAFAVLGVFLVWLVLSSNKLLGIVMIIIAMSAYIFLPFIFDRMSEGETGSMDARILTPLEVVLSNEISVFGLNPDIHYDNLGSSKFFANTITFIYIYFGCVGVYVFYKYIRIKKIYFLTIAIVSITVIEGLYGRIDFWMMVLAAKLFSQYLDDQDNKVSLNSKIA